MSKQPATPRRKGRTTVAQRRSSRRGTRGRAASTDAVAQHGWTTGITRIEPNRIMVRGYAVDEMMGRVSFADAVYLVLTGDLPTPAVGRIVEALLVSALDHGATPPSTQVARNVATTGAPVRASVAAGVLAFGSPLGGGGSIDACFRFLEEGLALVGDWVSFDDAARRMVDQMAGVGRIPPGFGHRFHTLDPRAARLLQLALELEIEGRHVAFIRAVELVVSERRAAAGEPPLTINIDGAIAAICGDLGLDAETANVLFMVSRIPGIVAHALEEQRRQPAMRQIDPTSHSYDGPDQRRLPETRR